MQQKPQISFRPHQSVTVPHTYSRLHISRTQVEGIRPFSHYTRVPCVYSYNSGRISLNVRAKRKRDEDQFVTVLSNIFSIAFPGTILDSVTEFISAYTRSFSFACRFFLALVRELEDRFIRKNINRPTEYGDKSDYSDFMLNSREALLL